MRHAELVMMMPPCPPTRESHAWPPRRAKPAIRQIRKDIDANTPAPRRHPYR